MTYRVRWTKPQQDQFVARWLEFRSKYGLTQEQLADAMGIHVNTVNRVERGKFVPQDATVRAFAEVEAKYKAGTKIKRALSWVPGEAEEI